MWTMLAAAVLACVVVLYAPGYFAGRAVRLGSFGAIAVAPAFSVALLVAMGVLLQAVGIPCPAWALLLAVLLFSLVGYGASRFILPKHDASASNGALRMGGLGWKVVGLYIGISLLTFCIVFVHAMADPCGFCRLDDSAAHYTLIRSFLDTGFYSTLNTNGYATLGGSGGYYPAAWHVAVAIVASLFDGSVALASNAMMLAVCVFVLPLGLLFMIKQLFADREGYAVVVLGSVVAVAFCGFPWAFLVWGQLLPNLLSFSLIPAAVGLLVAISQRGGGVVSFTSLVISFVVCVAAVAIAQPNGVFTLGVWAVAFSVSWILGPKGVSGSIAKKRAVAAVFFAVACLAWVALFFAPPLHSVTSYTWKAFLSPEMALLAGSTFMFFERLGIQPFLTVLVVAGAVRLCKNRQHRWLVATFLFAWVLWFIGATTDGSVKQFLSGFWYTDYRRTGGMAALFAIPIAAVGFAWLFEAGKALVVRVLGSNVAVRKAGIMSAAALLTIMPVVQFFPLNVMVGDSDIRAGLVAVHKQVKSRYSWENVFTGEEDAFVKKCVDVVPEGAVVANFPNDGSCYAYGIDGLNTFFRRSSPSAYVGPEETGRLIRTALSSVSTSPTVQDAVKESGVQYVLLLDCGSGEDSTVSKLRYKEEDWEGIEAINDETPGFTPVLSEGDMRLYRIDAAFE